MVKTGKGVRWGHGLKKNEGKRWEERARKHARKTLILVPYDLGTLSWPFKCVGQR